MKYIFVPISIVGCGKSTVFRTLAGISSRFVHIENDYFSGKRAFYQALTELLEGPEPYILIDRNNHLKMHRRQLLDIYKNDNVRFVALLFVPATLNKKRIFDVNWKRIISRGDNHPQVKSGSNTGQARMILSLFIKDFDAFDPKGKFDSQFDYVLQMKYGNESSRDNVDILLNFIAKLEKNAASIGLTEAETGNLPTVQWTKDEVDSLFKKSLAFKVPPKVPESVRTNSQEKNIKANVQDENVKTDVQEENVQEIPI